MSHELRTPLNAILGFAQLMEMGTPSPRQRQHVEQILKGGRHLLRLINEVLDLARIEAGHMPLTATHTYSAVGYPWVNHEIAAEGITQDGWVQLGQGPLSRRDSPADLVSS